MQNIQQINIRKTNLVYRFWVKFWEVLSLVLPSFVLFLTLSTFPTSRTCQIQEA
jgi:hypothetical protein